MIGIDEIRNGRLRMFRPIVVGRNLITHDLGWPPSHVSFFDGHEQVFIDYKRSDGQPDCQLNRTIVVVSTQAYDNLEINLI